MTILRLRSQLFIAVLLIILGITGSLLYFIRHTVNAEIQKQVKDGTDESVRAFESVQRQRELQLSRTAAMLADLPTLKALMSTEHAPTIQDGSESFWKLAGSDLFVLAKPGRQVVALHMNKPGWSLETAEADLKRSYDMGEDASCGMTMAVFTGFFCTPSLLELAQPFVRSASSLSAIKSMQPLPNNFPSPQVETRSP